MSYRYMDAPNILDSPTSTLDKQNNSSDLLESMTKEQNNLFCLHNSNACSTENHSTENINNETQYQEMPNSAVDINHASENSDNAASKPILKRRGRKKKIM